VDLMARSPVLIEYRFMKTLCVSGLLLWLTLMVGCSSFTRQSGAPMVQPPAATQNKHSVVNRLLEQFQQWRGVEYRYGGLSTTGVDCSGFVLLTFRDQFKVALPRSTQRQAKVGTQVSIAELKPGDLVLFKIGFSGRHVGIYAGEKKFLHASTSRGVIFSRLDSPYWKESFWQARRVL
jgi:probable lipoprotein NlpC